MHRTAWDRARVEQYAERTNQPLLNARYYLHRIYTAEGKLDLAALDAVIDPVVDESLRSTARTLFNHR